MTARKHHFVSQFYLKNFSTRSDENAKLCAVERETGRIFFPNVRDVAAKRDFNRLYVEGVDQNELETRLSEIEADCAPQFEKIIKDKSFDVYSRDALTTFIAIMFLNGQQTRGVLESFIEEKGNLQLDLMVNDKNLHKRLNITLEEAEEVRAAHRAGAIKLKSSQNYIIKMQFTHLEMIRKIVEKRVWKFLKTSSNDPFITCDNPVCLEWNEAGHKMFGDLSPAPSLFATESILLFPVSPELLLLGSLDDNSVEGICAEISRKEVAMLNGRIAKNSIRQFFAINENFSIQLGGEVLKAKNLKEAFKANPI